MCWESAQSGDGDELDGMFVPLARLIPGNIYVQYAFLDGEYVYAGFRDTWIVWNWRQDEILNLTLEVCLLSRQLLSATDVPFSIQMLCMQCYSRHILQLFPVLGSYTCIGSPLRNLDEMTHLGYPSKLWQSPSLTEGYDPSPLFSHGSLEICVSRQKSLSRLQSFQGDNPSGKLDLNPNLSALLSRLSARLTDMTD